jgi:protoporphyrinogen/coproporphyrinogen III oxidase
MTIEPKVAIIGAGLTGLTAAHYLKKSGLAFTIFEKNKTPGGVIRTFSENGFIYETGPNTGVLGHPEVIELLEELHPNCELEVADQSAKSRWIWKKDRWQPLPSGLLSAVSTPLFTFGDKLRILGEPFRKKGANPDESLADMVVRRMGKSFLNYAVDPFILGIYAGDPNYLIPKYALPKLYNLEQNYGSFIRGAIKKSRESKSERDKKATREIFSVKNGLRNFIDALVKSVDKSNILTGCRDIRIIPDGDNRFQVSLQNATYENFTHVISTAGAHELHQLIPFAGSELENHITCLKYAKVAQISIGFKKYDGIPLRAFGGLVPFEEHRDILGALFISSFLKDRAPEGGALLSVFMGGLRRPELAELSDSEIVSIVEREINDMMRLKEFKPDLLKIHRYDHAIPQYGPESEKKLAAIELLETQYPGLNLAGNLRDGIGMADRIKQGRDIALKISTQHHGPLPSDRI